MLVYIYVYNPHLTRSTACDGLIPQNWTVENVAGGTRKGYFCLLKLLEGGFVNIGKDGRRERDSEEDNTAGSGLEVGWQAYLWARLQWHAEGETPRSGEA